jgi:hypothetical protein
LHLPGERIAEPYERKAIKRHVLPFNVSVCPERLTKALADAAPGTVAIQPMTIATAAARQDMRFMGLLLEALGRNRSS